jgi:hypothetical protein
MAFGSWAWEQFVSELPEEAIDLVPCCDMPRCLCVYGDVPDPDDAEDAAFFGRRQRTKFALTEYVSNCPRGNHAQRYLDKLWRRADN